MKILAVILSCYIAILACKPCVDEEPGHQGKELAMNHNDAGHTNDLCSPLCICACCGAFMLNYAPLEVFGIKRMALSISTTEPAYKSVFISRYFGSIWQPPQIV